MLHTLWGSISAEALTEWDTGAAESWRVLSGGSLERIEERRAWAWVAGARMCTGTVGYGEGSRESDKLKGTNRQACVASRAEVLVIE